MFREKQFSGLRIENIKGKDVYIVDRHQYTLPIWGHQSLKNKMSYELVSIDYHPDTQPPFWQRMQFKAINKNADDMDLEVKRLTEIRLSRLDKDNIFKLIEDTHELNNDEHIYTALSLGYLNTYHMINCMDDHDFKEGSHYLVPDEHFSSLKDDMFTSIRFEVPRKAFILDIDLDYFLDRDFANVISYGIFERLVKESAFITIARSVKYFEYLKREDFQLHECEDLLLKLIERLV